MGREGRALAECLHSLYSELDLGSFPGNALRTVRSVVPGDYGSYNEANAQQQRVAWLLDPADSFPGAERVFGRYMSEHPCFLHQRRIRDGEVWRLSDFVTQRQFHRLGLYNEYYRRKGAEHQLGVRLASAASLVIAVGVNRGRLRSDFSDREVLRLQLLAPHLVQAYKNAEIVTGMRQELALVERGLDAVDAAVVVLRGAQIRHATIRARHLLDRYFERAARPADLPDALRQWLGEQVTHRDRPALLSPPSRPLTVARAEGHLTVQFIPAPSAPLLLLQESRALRARALEPLGLTRREAEVLVWVAGGKTNGDIATILGMSPRTVAKHLERVYQKLGVETRTAASIRALDALRSHARSD